MRMCACICVCTRVNTPALLLCAQTRCAAMSAACTRCAAQVGSEFLFVGGDFDTELDRGEGGGMVSIGCGGYGGIGVGRVPAKSVAAVSVVGSHIHNISAAVRPAPGVYAAHCARARECVCVCVCVSVCVCAARTHPSVRARWRSLLSCGLVRVRMRLCGRGCVRP